MDRRLIQLFLAVCLQAETLKFAQTENLILNELYKIEEELIQESEEHQLHHSKNENIENFRVRRQTETFDLKPLVSQCNFELIKGRKAKPLTPTQLASNNGSIDETTDTSATGDPLCGMWTTSGSAWRRSRASHAHFRGGPPVDVDGISAGHYMLFDASSAQKQTAISPTMVTWLSTPILPHTTSHGACFSFWYSLRGLGVSALRVVLIYDLDVDANDAADEEPRVSQLFKRKILWQTNDVTEPQQWRRATVSFMSSTQYQIVIEGVISEVNPTPVVHRGFIAIDNTQFFKGFCRGDCNFDIHTCAWNNTSPHDDFDWELGWGSTSSDTGPLHGHITKAEDSVTAGGYLFINSQYPRRSRDQARLRSPVFSAQDEPFCMKFWVSQFGTGIGNLSVGILPALKETTVPVYVWSLTEALGGGFDRHSWFPAQVTVSSREDYQVVIDGTVGIPGRGNIAIDDISFQPGPCSPLPASASQRAAECAFVGERCNWQVLRSEQANGSPDLWTLVTGGNLMTTPRGHTQLPPAMNDAYMKFETNNFQHNPLDKSRLLSAVLPPANETTCLNFWVYISSPVATVNGLGALQVLLLNKTGHGSERPTTVWRLEGHQQPRWLYSQVAIRSAVPFQIAFEGIRGAQVLGLIAVDDISMFPLKKLASTKESSDASNLGRRQRRQDELSLTTENPLTSPVTTLENLTKPTKLVEEAPEPSTELPTQLSTCQTLPARASVYLSDCAFDSDFCGWTPAGSDNVRWQLAKPTKSPNGIRDHTFNIPQAGFIYYDPFTPSGNPVTTTLESPFMVLPPKGLCMTFWFMAYGNDISTTLTVSQRTLTSEALVEIWKSTEATVLPQWHFAQLTAGVNTAEPFKVVIAATARLATIVVDDIKFYPDLGDHCRRKP